MYRATTENDAYSITDEALLAWRRLYSFVLVGVLSTVGVIVTFGALWGVANAGSLPLQHWPVWLSLVVLAVLSRAQFREARRFIGASVAREHLLLEGKNERTEIPWRDIVDVRAGRGLIRDVGGFVTIRFSSAGVRHVRYTVAPGAEAARAAAEEIRRRAALAKGTREQSGGT